MDELLLAIIEDRRRGEGLLWQRAFLDEQALDDPLTAERTEVGDEPTAAVDGRRRFRIARRGRS